jgi:hypothetical protein
MAGWQRRCTPLTLTSLHFAPHGTFHHAFSDSLDRACSLLTLVESLEDMCNWSLYHSSRCLTSSWEQTPISPNATLFRSLNVGVVVVQWQWMFHNFPLFILAPFAPSVPHSPASSTRYMMLFTVQNRGHPGGRCLLREPSGKPFYAIGINHVEESTLLHSHNESVHASRYPTRDGFISKTVSRLQLLAFNTLGWTPGIYRRVLGPGRRSRLAHVIRRPVALSWLEPASTSQLWHALHGAASCDGDSGLECVSGVQRSCVRDVQEVVSVSGQGGICSVHKDRRDVRWVFLRGHPWVGAASVWGRIFLGLRDWKMDNGRRKSERWRGCTTGRPVRW